MAKNRPLLKAKTLFLRVENRNAYNVGRQQIGRKLDALELRVAGNCKGFSQRGFSGTRNILKQHMSAGAERRQ